MRTNIDRAPAQTSAIIIQFPTGGRAGLSAHHDDTADRTLPNVMYGAWYHDEAITQSVTPKKG